ncbi:hypothetical protein AB3464_26550 [Pseudomonas asplenii]|uniref:hypothetical protein n=1 Tax=Pseudomonas asplenii TaxID=53407 RepID=UPI0037C8663C
MNIFQETSAEQEKEKIESELRSFGFSKFTIKKSNITTTQIAEHIGTIALPLSIQKITPRTKDKLQTNTYSGNFGLDAFPLHTDLAHWSTPPHYVILRCIQPAEEVKTLLLDFKKILSPEDSSTLSRALFRPRRSLENKVSLLRLSENEKLRWDSLFLQPVNATAKNLAGRILEKINNTVKIEVNLASNKDCLILDNWRILHGRTAVPEHCKNRILERIYLSSMQGAHNV